MKGLQSQSLFEFWEMIFTSPLHVPLRGIRTNRSLSTLQIPHSKSISSRALGEADAAKAPIN
jgi:hypothetical protein